MKEGLLKGRTKSKSVETGMKDQVVYPGSAPSTLFLEMETLARPQQLAKLAGQPALPIHLSPNPLFLI